MVDHKKHQNRLYKHFKRFRKLYEKIKSQPFQNPFENIKIHLNDIYSNLNSFKEHLNLTIDY